MKPEQIKAVASAALDRWEAVAAALDPDYKVEGDEVLLLRDLRGDRSRGSFSFNKRTGLCGDFATGEKGGGDLVDLWAMAKGLPPGEAADEMAAVLGLDAGSLGPAPARRQEVKEVPGPVPLEAEAAIPAFKSWAQKNRHAVAFWEVRDQAGALRLLRVRAEAPGGKAEVLPYSWGPGKRDGCMGWWKGGGFMRLFFGLERLASRPAAPVLVVEGEKTACAAAMLFPSHVVLGLMGAASARKVDLGPLQGRDVVLWPDADRDGVEAMRGLAARLAEAGGHARIVEVPPHLMEWCKPSRPGHPGGWDLADQAPEGVDIRALLEAAKHADMPGKGKDAGAPPDRKGCYLVNQGRLCIEKDGEPRPLCNFVARIREEVIQDDGEEEALLLLVEAALENGQSLGVAKVPAAAFAGMGWIMLKWGSRPIINPGNSTKDQLRAAIQHLSRPAFRRTYLNTGWRELEGQWCYLHAGGAIGPDGPVSGVDLDLSGQLSLYDLGGPLRGPELGRALRSSMRTLDLGRVEVTGPVWLSAFRAVVDECPFSIHISGSMKTGKTELASIATGHFGPGLKSGDALASWESTSGALERTLFLAKDALGLVDDFRPGGNPKELAENMKKADRIFRGAFNRASRGRLSSDAKTQRQSYVPRGLVLSTGEDLPGGESLRSRVLCLEWGTNDMQWKVLDGLQGDRGRGLHAGLMAAFIQWQARDRGRAKAMRQEAHAAACKAMREAGENNRTADIAANLWSVWPVLAAFAGELGLLSGDEIEATRKRLWEALLNMVGAQASIIADSNPAERFRDGLRACLQSGRGHLESAEKEGIPTDWLGRCGWREEHNGEGLRVRRPLGNLLGYLSTRKEEVWLIDSAAFQEVNRLKPVEVSERALWTRLKEQPGWMPPHDRGSRNKTRRILHDGSRNGYIVLYAAAVWEEAPDFVGQSTGAGQSAFGSVPAESSAAPASGTNGPVGTQDSYTPPLASGWGEL